MNITLIGMPGVGKSFLGKQLAKKLSHNFLDVDEVIEKKTGLKLQQIIDNLGDEEFLKIEERAILELGEVKNSVIAPGGSVIYLPKAMDFLKKISVIVFLNAPFEFIEKRLVNRDRRGIVGLKNKDLKTLFDERTALYKKYADFTVEVLKDSDFQVVVDDIIVKTSNYFSIAKFNSFEENVK